MPGVSDLAALLSSMEPRLDPDEYVFATSPELTGNPVGAFRETEGWTLILRRAEASILGIEGTFPCRMISLTVHSSLEAIGLLAVLSTELARREIAVNVVSGYYHDHLFVPVSRAEEAMEALRTIRRSRP